MAVEISNQIEAYATGSFTEAGETVTTFARTANCSVERTAQGVFEVTFNRDLFDTAAPFFASSTSSAFPVVSAWIEADAAATAKIEVLTASSLRLTVGIAGDASDSVSWSLVILRFPGT